MQATSSKSSTYPNALTPTQPQTTTTTTTTTTTSLCAHTSKQMQRVHSSSMPAVRAAKAAAQLETKQPETKQPSGKQHEIKHKQGPLRRQHRPNQQPLHIQPHTHIRLAHTASSCVLQCRAADVVSPFKVQALQQPLRWHTHRLPQA